MAGGAYVYLYNPSDSRVTFAPSVEGKAVPTELDLWNGSVRPVAQYTNAKGRTIIPTPLAGKEVRILSLNARAASGVRSISQVHGESGVGTYASTATLPDGWNADHSGGMWLQLGAVDGTADITVNNQLVGTQIDNGQRWDITTHLHPGANTVQIAVRTTLRNAVTTYNAKSTVTQPYGLRGPVTLVPYGAVAVSGKQR